MAPPRVPLQEILGNMRRWKELTAYERAEMVGAAKCSVKALRIGKELSYSRRTIRTTFSRARLRKNGPS